MRARKIVGRPGYVGQDVPRSKRSIGCGKDGIGSSTYNPRVVREVFDQIFGLCELLQVRRARDTALQQSRRRHVGVQYGESGEVVGWGWRKRRVDREEGEGFRLIFRSPAKTLNLWGSAEEVRYRSLGTCWATQHGGCKSPTRMFCGWRACVMSRACFELGYHYRLAITRDDEARENGTTVLEGSIVSSWLTSWPRECSH